ncbi:lytic transglycosylase domain-containing protein [Roseovarius sp. EL26]|uniref:lytic transglycosylase domain-containing protein n=1 Tax=Roseovarius sp. EL26 TaxID=2126672 RepID=UPI000EA1DC84|nr:lytic transglycosylase domain-containing protein [Roseovarius sp. EL26]
MGKIVSLILSGALLMPAMVLADDPPAFQDFTFKRQKPPKPGTKRFITVQIEPQLEQPAKIPEPEAEKKTPKVPEVSGAKYGWYWQQVSPASSEDPTERLRLAISTLSKGPAGKTVKGPRLGDIQKIAHNEGANILRATLGTKVSPALVLAVISVESGGRADALSGAGAQGLMQLIPATAERFGVNDSLSAQDNIKGGVAYLDWLLREFEGDAVLALAGYNAGENAVKRHEGVPPYAETRDYVPKVLAAYQVARALCKTQPELVTDACALQLASN